MAEVLTDSMLVSTSRKNDEFMVKEVMSGKKRFWTWRSHFHRERFYGCAGR